MDFCTESGTAGDSGVFPNDFSRYLLFSMDHRAESRYDGNMASKKEGEDWVNVSEEGYGFADTDGMYLSCQSMIAENIYTLTVVFIMKENQKS